MQLSELEIVSQSVPFALKDLSLGPCTHDPQLLSYKTELEGMREEVKRRVDEMTSLRAQLAALQGEHQKNLEELEASHNCLEFIKAEKQALQAEVCVCVCMRGCFHGDTAPPFAAGE